MTAGSVRECGSLSLQVYAPQQAGGDHSKNRAGVRSDYRIIFLLFFLSGGTSLVYEVLWMRRLSLVFGHSIFSVSTILTVFMTGLAVGSFLAGRWSDGRKKEGKSAGYFLAGYGKLELFIGLWALASLFLLNGVESLYLALSSQGYQRHFLNSAVFLSSFAVLLPPTVAMGATLPIFTQALVNFQGETGEQLSKLYGFNTLGACLGGAMGGLVLLPNLGLIASVGLTALVNALIAVSAFRVARRDSLQTRLEPADNDPDGARPVLARSAVRVLVLPFVFSLSGFAGMVYQLAWTRALVLSMGSSTYSFSLILTAFLATLSIGSLLYKFLYARRRPTLGDLALLQVLIAVTALGSSLLLGRYPIFKVWALRNLVESFYASAALDTLSVVVMIGLPTMGLGLTFPLVTHLYATELEELGRRLGEAYASNTAGAILGSFLGGFLLVPTLGAQGSLKLAVLLNLLGGLAVVVTDRAGKGLLTPANGLALVATCGLIFLPAWDRGILSSGASVYRSVSVLKKPHFYKDGITSTVTVGLNSSSEVFLAVNGKVDASTSPLDRQTQLLLGLLPSVLHPEARTVGVIGFGSGQTVIALLSNPAVERVVCAELEPAVMEAARFFEPYSEGYFQDSRLEIVEDDGRSFILGSPSNFDIIVSEPSNPWIAGIGNLYTRDFYQGCRAKLKEGGVMCQWFHLYSVGDSDLQMVLRTFYSVFPEGLVFRSSTGDILLMGSEQPLDLSDERLARAWETPEIVRWFYSFGLVEPNMIFGTFLGTRDDVISYLGNEWEAGALNTDDKPLLEFEAPLALFKQESVIGELDTIFPALVPPGRSGDPEIVQAALLGRLLLGFPLDLERGMETLGQLDPEQKRWHAWLFELVAPQRVEIVVPPLSSAEREIWIDRLILAAGQSFPPGLTLEALANRVLNDLHPGSEYAVFSRLGLILGGAKRMEEASAALRKAAEFTRGETPLLLLLELQEPEDRDLAVATEAVERNPYHARARFLLAQLMVREEKPQEALEQAQESHRLYSLDHQVTNLLYEIYTALGRQVEAEEMLRETTRLRQLDALRRRATE